MANAYSMSRRIAILLNGLNGPIKPDDPEWIASTIVMLTSQCPDENDERLSAFPVSYRY